MTTTPRRKAHKPQPQQQHPRASIEDRDGTLREQFADIASIVSYGSRSKALGARYAAGFTLASLQRLPAPPDMTPLSADELITLAVHGDDYRTREAAARELARRIEDGKQ